MIRFISVLVLFIAIAASAACGNQSVMVRNYCDSAISYSIHKKLNRGGKEVGHFVYVRVGSYTGEGDACSDLNRFDNRTVNDFREVTTQEEAEKTIEEAKQRYAAMLASEKFARPSM